MTKLMCLLAFAAACSGDDSTMQPTCADGSDQACGNACVASFTGNFDAETTGSANCATLSGSAGTNDVTLELGLGAGKDLDAPLMVSIDLSSAPTAGEVSSETTTSWSALGLREVGSGACVFSAGASGVPTGSFTMTLTSIDATSAHGELVIEQFLQAQPGVDCGAGDTETVDARF